MAVHVPFLPDRAGLVPMAQIPQITEVATNAIGKSQLLSIPRTNEDKIIVVVKAQEIELFPEFYKFMNASSHLFVHCNIRDLGTKSFNAQFHIYDETNTVLLWRNIRSLVTCDLKMKPVPIPESVAGFLTSIAIHKERFFCPLPFAQRPDNVFTTHVVPRPSDLDTLYHVNQSNYVTYMLDAAVSAAKAGFYKSLRQDIAFSSVGQIIFNYYKELLSEDDVKIETWQDDEDPLKICFQMSTHSQIAFQGSVLLQEPLLRLSDEIKSRFPRAKEF